MGLLSFLLLGLVAGAIAKRIMGTDRGGCLVTMLLGIAGAMVGGWLGITLFGVPLGSFFSLRTWLLSIGGSLVVLFVYGLITGGRSGRR
ncbi:GlsB/YeaQ/YmgE family stress response membrane protein [uncultured Propionibacterium sp.]|uniref:GlsB/YeaQ/YmgE family stress response membrane protein n=1 Tax=uncultured Propionibacterium sp. TaxID=218066 RepID=UPI00292CE81B|nr:GlsB/YeaQ/YmgE family stress response membrane protein [uncultured Propionibacterium sp.]